MGPDDLVAAKTLANKFDAQYSEIVGEELLEKNFPLIHAVGHLPRNQDYLQLSTEIKAKVTLVRKGLF